MTGGHRPVVSALADGTWGVFCDACSEAQQDYVYPCRLLDDFPWPDDHWPPAVLVDAP